MFVDLEQELACTRRVERLAFFGRRPKTFDVEMKAAWAGMTGKLFNILGLENLTNVLL